MSEEREIRVEGVMVTDLYSIDGLATVSEAIQMMKRNITSVRSWSTGVMRMMKWASWRWRT